MLQLLVGLPIVLAIVMFITTIGGLTRSYIFEEDFKYSPYEGFGCFFVGFFAALFIGVLIIGEPA